MEELDTQIDVVSTDSVGTPAVPLDVTLNPSYQGSSGTRLSDTSRGDRVGGHVKTGGTGGPNVTLPSELLETLLKTQKEGDGTSCRGPGRRDTTENHLPDLGTEERTRVESEKCTGPILEGLGRRVKRKLLLR